MLFEFHYYDCLSVCYTNVLSIIFLIFLLLSAMRVDWFSD